jgi:acyl-coenzyme A thioesterase PaaI-like protein
VYVTIIQRAQKTCRGLFALAESWLTGIACKTVEILACNKSARLDAESASDWPQLPEPVAYGGNCGVSELPVATMVRTACTSKLSTSPYLGTSFAHVGSTMFIAGGLRMAAARSTSPAVYKRLLQPASPAFRTYSTSPPPPRRTFSQRFQDIFYFAPSTWIGFTLFSGIAGAAYCIMSTSDFIVYTDEESLRKFTPSSPKQIEVEEYINNHPLAQSLRSKPEFTESRPTLKVNEQYRNSSLTSGVLAGPGKIVVPPYVWTEEGGKSLVSIQYLGQELCGYPGLIHGGLLATLLDEGLARCSFPALPNKIGMTANLTINYRKPSPAESFVVLKARTVKVEGRKAWVEGHIETLPKDGEEPVVLVEASALMVEPKQAKVHTPYFEGIDLG